VFSGNPKTPGKGVKAPEMVAWVVAWLSQKQHPEPLSNDEEGHPQALFYTNKPYTRLHGNAIREGGCMDKVPGVVEVAMEAGDILVFINSVV
jgi:hypothetical protein